MRKIISVILVLLICAVINFNIVGCSSSDNISVIYLKDGNKICPIDVYKITGGVMWEIGNPDNEIELSANSNYFADSPYRSSDIYYTESPPPGLTIDFKKLKLSVVPYKNGFNAYDGKYYSEYWGNKVPVLFSLEIEFYKTYPIKIKEKNNSYVITYYNLLFDTTFDRLNELEEYKIIREIPITDVSSIRYKN